MGIGIDNLLSLKDKVVVITGTSRGLGLEIAKKFLSVNSIVVGASRNSVSLGGNYFHYYLDLNSICSIEKFSLEIRNMFHYIDVLVHNASVPGFGGISDVSLKQWNEVMNVNIRGPLFLTKMLLQSFNDNGSIIFVSTIITNKIKRNKLLYSVSKGAINILVKNLSLELAERNIRVNTISPTIMETSFRNNIDYIKNNFDKIISETPLKRICKKEEVANSVLFLSSKLAYGITGINLKVDLGRSLI